MTTATAIKPTITTIKTITVRPSDALFATATMTGNGWGHTRTRVPAGTYRVVRDRAPLWTIQDDGEMQGDVAGTYYYVERREAVGLL